MPKRNMSASEFKTHCLAVMATVRATREPVVITKRGRAIAKLVPADEAPQDLLGRLRGVVRVKGDIESPIAPKLGT